MFDPTQHLEIIERKHKNTGKVTKASYLAIKWRLCWLREDAPTAKIETELVHLDLERGFACFKARITKEDGASATGYGSETAADFADYIEKAESKAIGRAAAALGYGTSFALELDEGDRIADAPVEHQDGQEHDAGTHPSVQDAEYFMAEVTRLFVQMVTLGMYADTNDGKKDFLKKSAKVAGIKLPCENIFKVMTQAHLEKVRAWVRSEENARKEQTAKKGSEAA